MIAAFAETLDDDWLRVPSVRLERRATHSGTPDRYVLVEHGAARFRCDICLTDPEAFPFEDIQVWHDLLLIGYGSTFYTVDLNTRAARVYPLRDYFGSIVTSDAYCLVASGERILRINRDGSKMWESDPIAVDGIIISSVDDGRISGEAEWDPPGGWRPFVLSLATGRAPLER